MRRTRLTVLAVVVLATACSGPAEEQSQVGPSTSPTASNSPTVSASSPTRPTGPAPVPRWTRLQRGPVDGDHLVATYGRYVVSRAGDAAGTTSVVDGASQKVVVRHRPPAGFIAQSPVVLDGRYALVEEVRSEGPSPEIRAYRYDLTTGAKEDLARAQGFPRITEPEIGASGGTFAYATTDTQRRSCLVVATLSSLATRVVGCVADPGYIADPVVSTDSVTFSEITAPGTAKRCKRLLTAALSGGPAKPVVPAKPCLQWSGGTVNGATVWSEVVDASDQYQSQAYLRDADGSRPLGTILTDTIVPCGSWIYWEVRRMTGGAESYEIHRWRSGAEPQQVYVTPPDSALSAPSCQGTRLLVESAHLGAGAKYADALVADAG